MWYRLLNWQSRYMQACEMPILRLFSNIDRNYLCTQWKSRVPGEVDLYVLSKFWCFFVCLSACFCFVFFVFSCLLGFCVLFFKDQPNTDWTR